MTKEHIKKISILICYGIVLYAIHNRYNTIHLLETDWYYTVAMYSVYVLMILVTLVAFIFNFIPLVSIKLDPVLNNTLHNYYILVISILQMIETVIIIKIIYTQGSLIW